jgi:membrane-associated HD superfamily phosphohydrolase
MRKQLKIEDLISATLFIVFITIILVGHSTQLVEQSILNKIIVIAKIIIPMYLFLWYFERLRIWSVFLFWIIAGVTFLAVSIYLTKSGNFKAVNGYYSDGGLSIITALLAFSIGQLLNKVIFHRNFIAGAWYSPNSDRKRDFFDIIITLIGIAAIIISWDINI